MNSSVVLIDSGECRLAMAREFTERFEEIQAWGLSTDIEELPVCLTADGLSNGSINMVAGMLIVAATVLLGVVEQLSGMYTVQRTQLVTISWISIVFHVGLAGVLLMASRHRIATVANDFWAVMEAAVTVFLVVELDDLVLFCVKRHPAVHHALVVLRAGPLSYATRSSPDVHPCTSELKLLLPAATPAGMGSDGRDGGLLPSGAQRQVGEVVRQGGEGERGGGEASRMWRLRKMMRYWSIERLHGLALAAGVASDSLEAVRNR